MTLELLGYELTGLLEAVTVLAIVALEATVLYVAYTGYIRLFRQLLDDEDSERHDQP